MNTSELTQLTSQNLVHIDTNMFGIVLVIIAVGTITLTIVGLIFAIRFWMAIESIIRIDRNVKKLTDLLTDTPVLPINRPAQPAEDISPASEDSEPIDNGTSKE